MALSSLLVDVTFRFVLGLSDVRRKVLDVR